eukprot:gnl/TRDRNA2_/TRDRNA2_163907_c1_seq1.p1 gnl/TRDRNA2_/TRDRNA2_163907_c1~~gnl/TRDRNA2_/TRDRNA2_163907_c1_seq1.p1  ORF type:complete len:101 (+),score=17.32 gnl/TRDRNA2_/TRDRNA2_163907_c1_seq1:666-968(+)
MSEAFGKKPRDVWLDRLRSFGVSAGPVNKMKDLLDDPQIRHRQMLRPTADGRFLLAGNPVKISEFSDAKHAPSPPAQDGNGVAIRAEFAGRKSQRLSSKL